MALLPRRGARHAHGRPDRRSPRRGRGHVDARHCERHGLRGPAEPRVRGLDQSSNNGRPAHIPVSFEGSTSSLLAASEGASRAHRGPGTVIPGGFHTSTVRGAVCALHPY